MRRMGGGFGGGAGAARSKRMAAPQSNAMPMAFGMAMTTCSAMTTSSAMAEGSAMPRSARKLHSRGTGGNDLKEKQVERKDIQRVKATAAMPKNLALAGAAMPKSTLLGTTKTASASMKSMPVARGAMKDGSLCDSGDRMNTMMMPRGSNAGSSN